MKSEEKTNEMRRCLHCAREMEVEKKIHNV